MSGSQRNQRLSSPRRLMSRALVSFAALAAAVGLVAVACGSGEDAEPARGPGTAGGAGNASGPAQGAGAAVATVTPVQEATPEPKEPEPTPEPSPTPTPEPTPTVDPASPGYAFEDGTHTVGEAVLPDATYRAPNAAGCFWERRTGLSGTVDDVAANDTPDGPAIVTIGANDVEFESRRCGTWSRDLSPLRETPGAPLGPGTWIVGTEVTPGTWQAPAANESCYWARLSGFSGELRHIIDNAFGDPAPTVTIGENDRGFQATTNCGEWVLAE